LGPSRLDVDVKVLVGAAFWTFFDEHGLTWDHELALAYGQQRAAA
jgi:hypothetical protein